MQADSGLNRYLKAVLIICCVSVAGSISAAEGLGEWKHADKLDEQTRAKLRSAEQFFAQLYEIPKENRPEDANLWMKDLRSGNRDLAPRAAACLGIFRIKEAREVLETAVTAGTSDNRVKWIAIRSLGLIADNRSAPVLIEILDHPNGEVRLYARIALTEIAGVYLGENKDKWRAWLKDPNESIIKGQGDEERDTDIGTGNKSPAEKLRRLIDEKYSYRDLRGVDWDKAFSTFGPLMERAQTPEQFAESASKLMERARDPHLWIKVGEKSIGGFKRNAVRNYNISTLRRIVPGFVERNKRVSTGRFEDGIGYILINNWSKDGDNLEPAFAALKEFSDAPGLIIDVRPNSGGSEPLAEEFAGCFVDKPVMYSKHIYRKADEPNGFSQPQERILQPNKKQVRYKGKVTVLMGQANMSSCESFLLMMKQAGCKLVGERSYGSSGNPKPYELGNGVTVWLPSWKDLLPDGTCLEGRGVLPDIGVSTTDAQLKNGDPVLDAGLKYLRGR
ncbi:MAG: S41 family peptidase [Sedimentisphaerales bacterium]